MLGVSLFKLFINKLKSVSDKYWFSKDGDIRKEIDNRIDKERTAFRNMEKLWNKDGMSLSTKLKLFNILVLFVLSYDCVTWKELKEIEERVRGFGSGFLRKNLKIRWYDKMQVVWARHSTTI